MCSEASLPGSSLATLEINNDRTGVTERHAHRKFFDDKIDLTFYVDVENYLPIIFFETWIDFASGAGTTQDFVSSDRNNLPAKNYYYRMNTQMNTLLIRVSRYISLKKIMVKENQLDKEIHGGHRLDNT